jgi:hypothetical protein
LKRDLQKPVEGELKRLGFFLTHRVPPILVGFLVRNPRKSRRGDDPDGESTTAKSEIRVNSGIAGFFHENVVNLDGKMNSDALAALRSGTLDEYLAHDRIDVMIDWPEQVALYISPERLREHWTRCAHEVPDSPMACWQRSPRRRARRGEWASRDILKPCATGGLDGSAGRSQKSGTACGAWAGGPAPTTTSR